MVTTTVGLSNFLQNLDHATKDEDVVKRTRRHIIDFKHYLTNTGLELSGLAGICGTAKGSNAQVWFGKGVMPAHLSEFHNQASEGSHIQLRRDRNPGGKPNAVIGRTIRSRGTLIEQMTGMVYLTLREIEDFSDHLVQELLIAVRAFLERMLCRLYALRDGFAYDLTPRECEVLSALAMGMQRAEMAHEASVTIPTIDLHLGNLRRKLGAGTLAEAVEKAHRYGVLV
jgi:DNA-binding CsgD family transcriptional regulator